MRCGTEDFSYASEHLWWRTLSSGWLLSDSWFSLLLANRNWRLLRAWLLWLLSSFGTGHIFRKWHLWRGISRWAAAAGFLKRTTKIPPAVLWVTYDKKKKKNPIVSNNQRKDKPVSDQRTCGPLRLFFYIPLSWCLTSFLSSDWPVLHPSPFILGITTKTDATLLFISCTRRSLLHFTPFCSF